MSQKHKKILAPIIIAGITIGFLASAYRFVFAKAKSQEDSVAPHSENQSPKQTETDQ